MGRWSHGIASSLHNSEASAGIPMGSCWSGWRPGWGRGSQGQVCRREASSDQGLGALQGFSGRGGSEIAGKQGEAGESVWGFQKLHWKGRTELGRWCSPRKQCLLWHPCHRIARYWGPALPQAGVRVGMVHCVMPGLQTLCVPEHCLGKTEPALRASVSQRGAHAPSLRAREATKGPKKAQAVVQHSWVKNGSECGLTIQTRVEKEAWNSSQISETKKALQRPNLLSGLVMADSRAGGEVVGCDVMSMGREAPQSLQ